MTNLTNKLFECYVAHPTHDEAVDIVERLVANGAVARDAVEGMDIPRSGSEYQYCEYENWGYNQERGTYTGGSDFEWAKRSKQLTMQEFRAAFPCDKYDSTTEDWPQPGDKVVVIEDEVKSDAIFIGKSSSGSYVCEMANGWAHGLYDGFRKDVLSKPKSDREKFIEEALDAANKARPECDATFAGKLYDAGFKAPEVL